MGAEGGGVEKVYAMLKRGGGGRVKGFDVVFALFVASPHLVSHSFLTTYEF